MKFQIKILSFLLSISSSILIRYKMYKMYLQNFIRHGLRSFEILLLIGHPLLNFAHLRLNNFEALGRDFQSLDHEFEILAS